MSYCDPDACLYSDTPTLRLDGCDEKVCREHEPAGIVPWHDGVDSGWLHARGICSECDVFWLDVDVNTAFYAEQTAGAA